MTKPVKPSNLKTYTFSQKWGDDPFTKMGHAQVPSALLRYGVRLGIDPAEGYLICHILDYKWTPSDDGPHQNDLAARFGRSVDRVHALLASLEKKKLLKITYTRGDFGKFTSAQYDFRQLRACLNECYYQDHPEERPAGKKPVPLPMLAKAAPQIRGAAKRSRESAETRSADLRIRSPRLCGLPLRTSAETPIDSSELEEKEEGFSASLFSERNSPEEEPEADRPFKTYRMGAAKLLEAIEKARKGRAT